MMLEITDLNVFYGAIHALKGVSFHLEQGEIVALIGANGAGKSTTLNTISRLVDSTSGDIRYKGESIISTPPQDIVSQGIVQVPEGRRIFPKMTVVENLDMGAYIHNDRDRVEQDMEEMFNKFPRLRERRNSWEVHFRR